MHGANHKVYNLTFGFAQVGQKVNVYTFNVKARPSRPSGKRTVSSFLSSLTTTLQMSARQRKIRNSKITNDRHLKYVQHDHTGFKRMYEIDTYLPELFRSIPPNVRFTSPLLCGNVLYKCQEQS